MASKKKKKRKFGICDMWLNLEGRMLSEVSQTRKDRDCVAHFYDTSKVARLVRAKNWMVVPGAGGRGKQGNVIQWI